MMLQQQRVIEDEVVETLGIENEVVATRQEDEVVATKEEKMRLQQQRIIQDEVVKNKEQRMRL